MNYTEAQKTPDNGWKHANNQQTLSVAAEMLARTHCLKPEAIYNWAVKYEITPAELSKLHSPDHNTALVCDVVNDSFKHTKSIIKN